MSITCRHGRNMAEPLSLLWHNKSNILFHHSNLNQLYHFYHKFIFESFYIFDLLAQNLENKINLGYISNVFRFNRLISRHLFQSFEVSISIISENIFELFQSIISKNKFTNCFTQFWNLISFPP